MPPVIPAVIAGGSLLATGGTFLGVAGIGGALLAGASSLALSFLSSALTPKPESPDLSSFASIKSAGATQQFRQPITERRSVYGECRVSGPIVYIACSSDNRYLHMFIALASHEVQEIGEIYVNDVSIAPDQFDGSNVVLIASPSTERYNGSIKIKRLLGTDSQTADPDMVADAPDWTSNHRLRGIAGIYARLEWDRDVFPSGIPNISAWMKGKKCFDTRDSVTRWTPNLALQARDYLCGNALGFNSPDSVIETSILNASANECDEFVTVNNVALSVTAVNTTSDIISLAGDRLEVQTGDKVRLTSGTIGGLAALTDYYVIVYQRKDTPRIKLASSLANAIAGTAINLTSGTTGTLTKTAEPRYFGGGVLKSSAERGNNLMEIISGMSGQAVFSGGHWRILAGAYQTPTISFDEGDLAGPIELQTKVSRRERFNLVQGVYVSPLNDGNPSDFPPVSNSTYQSEDGDIIKTDLNLSFTQRPATAQRISKIYLERMRQETTFKAQFKLSAFKVQVGDNFNFTFPRYGWSNKIFEVIEWRITTKIVNDVPVPVIEMTCRENDPSVYDWNNGEETSVDPAPNTNLPNPFEVDPPTGLAVFPEEIGTAEGDLTYKFKITWTPPDDYFVISGGKFEIEFKKSSDPEFRPSFSAEGDKNFIDVLQVQPGINYDCRVRAVNILKVPSAWTSLFGFNVSSPSGATISLDYGEFSDSVVEIVDYGEFSDSVTATLDYGAYV